MAKAPAEKAIPHPFRDAMFLMVVRNNLANGLVTRLGYSRSEARAAAGELADPLIEDAATKVAGTAANLPVAAGTGILAFLLSFISSPQFAQLIALLLSLFGVPVSSPLVGAEAPPPAPAAA